MSSGTAATALKPSALAILLAGVLYHALYFGLADPRVLMLRTPDDAAYFTEIALRAAHGQGFTFDGLHATNGFQPLWQWMLVPLARAIGDPTALFRAAILLQCLLAGLAGWLFLAWSARALSPRAMPLLALAWVVLLYRYALNGMETAVELLALTALAALAATLDVFGRRNRPAALAFGALLGVAFLARLDLVFLGAVIVVLEGARALRHPDRRSECLTRAALIVAGASAVVGPYLWTNLRDFGHLVPISGVIKSSFPHLVTDKPVLERLSPKDVVQLVLVVGWSVWAAFTPQPAEGEARRRRNLLRVAGAAMVLHGLDTLLFLKWAVFPWHFLWYGLLLISVVGDIADRVLTRGPLAARRPLARLGFAALMAATGVGLWRLDGVRSSERLERNWRVIAYETGLWARAHSDSSARFALADAGLFGLFSGRSTVNLDGLVNDFDFQRQLRDHRLARYLDANRVDYVVKLHLDQAVADTYDSTAFVARSRLYDTDDSVRVRRRDEWFRSRTFLHNGGNGVLVIWRWRDAGRAQPAPGR